MFGIEILVRRNIAEHIQVTSLRLDAVLEKQPVVFDEMSQHEARAEKCLRPAVPMAHEWNVAFLPIAETCAGERLRWGARIFFVNCELWIVRRRVNVVIA